MGHTKLLNNMVIEYSNFIAIIIFTSCYFVLIKRRIYQLAGILLLLMIAIHIELIF